ncbi:chromate transporter [Roseomonas sp. CAU 1739]|uniref:chromate transporter n=1 Tax=Roseomonas sp. CAU 1739 TaxID=3140364 RepID=UPI00325C0A98
MPVSDNASSEGGKDAIGVAQLFLAFLAIGATSFGSTIPYLRASLVERRGWLADKEFVELLSISQALPGLNATNMAILVGQKFAGAPGAIAAILGVCLPGALLMLAVGIVYRSHGDHAWASAALKGVSAASVGLTLSTVLGLSRRSLAGRFDWIFIVLTVIAVNRLHLPVLAALLGVGLPAVFWHRPDADARREARR